MNPAAAYIMASKEPYRAIMMHLQAVIGHVVPEAELTFKWKLPFYYLEGKPFCYMNCSKQYVDLGFWHSAHLSVHAGHLVSAGRKVIKTLRYTTLEDLDQQVLTDVLRDAYENRAKGLYRA